MDMKQWLCIATRLLNQRQQGNKIRTKRQEEDALRSLFDLRQYKIYRNGLHDSSVELHLDLPCLSHWQWSAGRHIIFIEA